MVSITYGCGLSEDCATAYSEHYEQYLSSPSLTVLYGDIFKITGTCTDADHSDYVYYASADLSSLGISSSTFPKCLIRFKTSESEDALGARIQLVWTTASGGGSTWVLGETIPEFSAVWKTVVADIDVSGRILQYIRFYADDYPDTEDSGESSVYYDFLLLHKGTFTFPFLSGGVELEFSNNMAYIPIPGRVGNITQYLGMDSPIIRLSGEMDTNVDWGTPKGKFLYKDLLQSFNDPWQWFTSDLINCKVTIKDFKINQLETSNAQRTWTLELRKYDLSSGSESLWDLVYNLTGYTGLSE